MVLKNSMAKLKMKDNLEKVRRKLELKEKHFEENIRDFFKIIGISYEDENKELIQNIISDGLYIQELNVREYNLMFKEALTFQVRWYRLIGEIRKPFSRIRHFISELFNRTCLSL